MIGGPSNPPFESAGDDNGRNARGQFAKGNAGGPGNPYLAKASKRRAWLRARMRRAIKPDRIDRCMNVLAEIMDDDKAKDSDRIAAVSLLLAYAVGRPAEQMTEDRLEALEAALMNGPANGGRHRR